MIKIFCAIPTRKMKELAIKLGISEDRVVLLNNIIISRNNNPNYTPTDKEVSDLLKENIDEANYYKYAIPYYQEGVKVNNNTPLIEINARGEYVVHLADKSLGLESYLNDINDLPKESVKDINTFKELYTVLLWKERIMSESNISSLEAYDEAISLLNEYKKIDPNYFEKPKPYKEVGSFPNDSLLASTKEVNGLVLITIKKVITPEEFYNYIQGNTNSETSKQKKLVLEEMEKLGITLDKIKSVLNTSEKIKQFIYLHELSHKLNYKEDMSKYNRENINAPENIAMELRAILYAWEQMNGTSNPFGTTDKTDQSYEDVMNLFEGKSSKAETKFSVSTSDGYPQRTRENTDWSDITLALVVDNRSRGETLTAQVAGSRDPKELGDRKPIERRADKYVGIPIHDSFNNDVEKIVDNIIKIIETKGLPKKNIKLNIAGNGIYSFGTSTQYYLNNLMEQVIKTLISKGITISSIRSGGQTGIDEAGIIAAQRLGIPNEVHTTSNYKFKIKSGQEIKDNETAFKNRFVNSFVGQEEYKKKTPVMQEQQDNTTIKEDLPSIGIPNYDNINLKVDKESPRAKLARVLTPSQIYQREQLIAREFSDVVSNFLEDTIEELKEQIENEEDEIVKLNLSNKLNTLLSENGRKALISEVGFDAINDEIKARFQDWIDMSDEDYIAVTNSAEKADYIRDQYQKILDNYDVLFNEASVIIEANEKARFSKEEVEKEDETGEKVHGSESYTYKIRFSNPHESSRGETRRALSDIKQVDSNGNPVLNDLGKPSYLREDYVHSILLGFLSKEVITPDDFSIYDPKSKTYIFPALNKLKESFPWVNQIINKLAYDPKLISIFYTDFRKEYISYWAQFDGKTVPLNTPVEIDSTIKGLIANYESGNIQDDYSVFNSNLNIIQGNVDKAVSLLNTIKSEIQKADEDDIKEVTDKVVKLLKILGFSEQNISKEILGKVENKTLIRNVLVNVEDILTKLKDFKEGSHYVDTYNSQFKNIATFIGKATELDAKTTFREMGNDYPSYAAPNELETIFKKLKDSRYRQTFLEKEYKRYDWFYPIINKETGEKAWKNEMLRLIESDSNILENMELKNVFILNRQLYADWDRGIISAGFIREYFYTKEDPQQVHNFGYFNFPIFSDTEMATFIKFKKYTGNFKEQLIPLFTNLVEQELGRMKLVQERRKKGIPAISNFDVRGAKFCFLPELNNVEFTIDNEKRTLLEHIKYYKEQDRSDKVKQAIVKGIQTVLNLKFEEFKKKNLNRLIENKPLMDTIKTNSIIEKGQTIVDKLEEYFWNQMFMTSQLIQITTTDLAFYKNSVDFQKRFKELYAAGTRLNTNSPYGRKVEKTVYISDNILTSPTYKPLSKLFKEAYDNGNISKMDYDSIMNKFKDVNATDGQAYRSISSYRAIMDMLGMWNDDLDETFNRLKSNEWDMGDINVVFQTIKPFVFGHVDTRSGVDDNKFIKVPHQNKNSEFLLLATHQVLGTILNKSEQLKALNDFMENNNIDVIQFESAVKVGCSGIININVSHKALKDALKDKKIKVNNKEYSLDKVEFKNINDVNAVYKDIKKYFDKLLDNDSITQEEYNDIIKYFTPTYDEVYSILNRYTRTKVLDTDYVDTEGYNHTSVHMINYDNYMIAQPTPEHAFDVESIFGSQFRNLIYADLPEDIEIDIEGTKIKGEENVKRFYFSLIIENLLESYSEVSKDFNNIESLQKRLLSIVKGNPKYGRDMLNALELVEYNGKKVFNMPFNDRMISAKIEELMTSVFKNNITKQYIKGASCIAVSNFGYTNELKVERNEDGSIKAIQCYLPVTSKSLYEPFLKEIKKNDKVLGYEIDYDKIKKEDESLLEIIGFRIPTEAKYSMLPLKIKGFLPQQNGSSIMLPAEVTTLSGMDYDVDKVFLFLPSFNIENNKVERIKYNINKEPKDNSKAQRDNAIIQVALSILRNKEVSLAAQIPGNFDTLKITARKDDIYTNPEYFNRYKEKYGITDNRKAVEHLFNNNDAEELSDFLKEVAQEDNPLSIDTFMKYHNQNMTGGALIGIYANNTTMQAKFQGKNLRIKDKFTFTVDGKLIKNLTDIYTEELVNGKIVRKKISQNCAEFSAASVDNVKDPVLASLLQNKNTARIACFMLRAGMSIPQIGVLFNIPLIRKNIQETGGVEGINIKNIEDKIKELREISEENSYKAPAILKFNTLDVMETSVNFNDVELRKNYSKEEEADLLEKMVGYVKGFYHIYSLAETLGDTVKSYRADSPNGAIDISLAKAKVQVLRVDNLLVKASKVDYPFEGVEDILNNNFINVYNSKDVMREKLLNSELPLLQAFYSLGIDLGLKTISPYFANTSEKANKIVDFIQANSYSILTESQISSIYEAINLFGLSGTSLFGKDDNMSMEEKYNYYTKQFPRDFAKIVSENPDIQELPFIQKLVTSNFQGLVMRDSARNTAYLREVLTNSADSLLYLDNPEAHKLALGLLRYAYYKEKLKYGSHSFNQFFSTIFKNAFPEYVETLRELEQSMNSDKRWDRLIDQIYANNPNLVEKVDLKSNEVLTLNDDIIKVLAKAVKNYNYMEYVPLDYISFKNKVYKLNTEASDDNNKVYDVLDTPLDVMYNMNNDSNNMTKDLNIYDKVYSNKIIEDNKKASRTLDSEKTNEVKEEKKEEEESDNVMEGNIKEEVFNGLDTKWDLNSFDALITALEEKGAKNKEELKYSAEEGLKEADEKPCKGSKEKTFKDSVNFRTF